jgi:hypothetical protein
VGRDEQVQRKSPAIESRYYYNTSHIRLSASRQSAKEGCC